MSGSALRARLGRAPPVDLLLHPLTLGGLAVMILNDGWLRGAYPGWVTGKLSDVAAVLAYPGVLAALWCLAAMAMDRAVGLMARGRGLDYSLGRGVVLAAALVTGAILVGINLSEPLRDLYLSGIRRLDPLGWLGPRHYTRDPSDLLALLALPGVWLAARQVLARVPAGRLRAAYADALRAAAGGTRAEATAAVDRRLADARQLRPGPALDALRDRIVDAAWDEASPAPGSGQNVAFDPAPHYHRIRQALETHRNRGQRP